MEFSEKKREREYENGKGISRILISAAVLKIGFNGIPQKEKENKKRKKRRSGRFGKVIID